MYLYICPHKQKWLCLIGYPIWARIWKCLLCLASTGTNLKHWETQNRKCNSKLHDQLSINFCPNGFTFQRNCLDFCKNIYIFDFKFSLCIWMQFYDQYIQARKSLHTVEKCQVTWTECYTLRGLFNVTFKIPVKSNKVVTENQWIHGRLFSPYSS